MNEKIRDLLFLCISVFLIFNNIPKPIQMNFIGGPVGNKLVFYPLLIGFIYTAYCQWKYKNVLVNFKPFVKYLLLYIGVMLLSLIFGLFNYPHWDDVFAGPINQIEKIPKIIYALEYCGVDVNVMVLTIGWIFLSQAKWILLETFWCFGGSYLIYCWYRNDWKRGIGVAFKGLLISAFLFISYGFIDTLYLSGSDLAKKILININPIIHTVKDQNGWWPPLLLKNQLRSVFSEPSHIGNYLAIILPILFFKYIEQKKTYILLLINCLSFLVILSKARTAYAMMFGILFLCIFVNLNDEKKYLKNISIIIIVVASGIFLGVQYMSLGKFLDVNIPATSIETNEKYTVENALDDNLLSLASSDKRSNGARYALIKTNLRIAAQHPLLGVGTGLGTAYMIDNYDDDEKSNGEVAMWIKNTKKYGIFASGKGIGSAMNEFITRLAQNGVVGLSVYLCPFIIAIYKLLRIGIKEKNIDAKMLAVILISILVSGCNGSVNIIYSIWIFLGISYAMVYDKKVNIDCNERA